MDNDWQYSFPELEGTATVEMVVDGEIISIEVNGDDAPVTASNFVDLVENGFYDGLMFHRVEEGFVAQGGDPQSRDPEVPPEELGAGGFIDPETGEERNIPLEIKPAGAEEPIYSQTFEEAEITVAPELPHTEGAIAMARTNDPDTASSQFYFALDDLPQLDGNYAVFGSVTDGMEVVDEIEIGDRIDYAVIVDGDIPSRSSSLISDSQKLNQLLNNSNKAKVSFVAALFDDEEEDSQETEDELLPEEESEETVEDSGEELLAEDDETVEDSLEELEDETDEELLAEDQSDEIVEEESTLPIPEESELQRESSQESPTEKEEPEDSDTASATEEEEPEDSENIADDTDNTIDMRLMESSSGAMMGLEGEDEIFGTDEDDIINGNQGNDTIFGLEGDDWLRGGKGNDSLIGGKGDDYLVGELGSDTLTGGEGNDTFILRADTASGVQDIADADLILDWQEGEGIAIVGEFDPAEDFSFELVGEDTVIKLGASDDILGVVQNTAIASVEENIFVVAPNDVALGIG
jgi:peptidyl-prolyl cis-trans isomerase B (cyclophilin B)